MVTLHDSMVSSSARRISIRKRADLVARRQHYLGRTYWVVKEPIGLQYFRFQEEEFAILNMLDGDVSLDEIKERFEAEFPPQKITLDELQQFLGHLHRSGLVVANVPGQGRQLNKRRGERKRKELIQAVSNILCIRFKGFDPERFLNWLYPYVSWFFSLPVVILTVFFGLSALTLVLVEFDQFQRKLPEFQQFFSVHNAFWLMVVLACTKICHEFGHGLSCKHFGGECHEMGVMVLVLTPCLYCNVSDSWMLPSKWARAAIGAAGMYVELVLASFATYIWWFTHPGLLHNLCLNVVFISSVSTVIFNANPLLRYDGYYILSDLVEIPNLRQKATTILGRKMGQWFLGMEMPEDPFLPQSRQGFFAFYTIAAAIYRWIVALSICWFLYKLFESYDLKPVGQLIVLASLYGLFCQPLYQLGKFFYVPGRLDKVKKSHFYPSLIGVAAIVAALCFVPLPHSVIAPLELQARDAEWVSVVVGGILESVAVKPGQTVKKGDVLAQLRNRELELSIAELESKVELYRLQAENLRGQSHLNSRATSEIASVEEALKSAEEQLAQRQEEKKRLCLTAPLDGVVLPPSFTPRREDPELQLGAWSGTPFDTQNVGAYLDERTLFCQIGDPKKLQAVMVIDQRDRNMVAPGQTVDLKIEGFPAPSQTIRSEITAISEEELKDTPKRLAAKHGGEVPTATDPNTGIEKPQSTSYQADAPLDDEDGLMRLGLRGTGRIYTRWMSVGERFWRFLSHTFNFKM
ncbi:MAG: biotin/lipoyl-binding protein [Pirellulales bacterium]|nr:biotin/lipoyl-binding protein [Pirellulales bacterium]